MVSISLTLDNTWISFPCPVCEIENDCQAQQAARGESVHCRGCHLTIQLVDKDSSIATSKRRLDAQLRDLQKALGKRK
jgi:hypothetical protein